MGEKNDPEGDTRSIASDTDMELDNSGLYQNSGYLLEYNYCSINHTKSKKLVKVSISKTPTHKVRKYIPLEYLLHFKAISLYTKEKELAMETHPNTSGIQIHLSSC